MDKTVAQKRGDYYMDVRQFNNGNYEVVVKAIRPMQVAAIVSSADEDSYINYCKANGLPTGFEVKKRYAHDDREKSDFQKSDHHRRNVRRAAQHIRHYSKQIKADRLFTLTTRENCEDRETFKKYFTRFLRLVKTGWKGQAGNSEWRYVAVLEKQDRGAFHVHCAVSGHQNVNFLRAAWHKALGAHGLVRGELSPGNVDVTTPRSTRWGKEFSRWKCNKLAAYLTKYLEKTFDESTKEKRRYFHSKDVVQPAKQRFILAATDFVSAIVEAFNLLGQKFSVAVDFTQSWTAPSQDSLWFSYGGPT